MDNNQNNRFYYTYSAKEQEEIKRIREKYTHREEDKMARLRRLDQSVMQKAQAASLILGILGALLLGFGMSLAMTDLGAAMGMGRVAAMVIGIIVGLVGCAPVAMAYPIYRLVLEKERAKVTPEILRLTDELMK